MPSILTPEEFSRFRVLVESQTPRALRRFLDYGKRLRTGQGLEELGQWLGRILLDDGEVYPLEDRALAFEVAACEYLAEHWVELQAPPESVTVCGPVDRTLIYRHLLQDSYSPERRSAFAHLLAQRYKRSWSFIERRASDSGASGAFGAVQPLLTQFLGQVDAVEPLEGAGSSAELEKLRAEVESQLAAFDRLRGKLEDAHERTSRAQQKIEQLDKERVELRRQLSEEREAAEKLRRERSRRIRVERRAREADGELERLKTDYVKLDQRLRQMAQRLVDSERATHGSGSATIDASGLRRMDAREVLGLSGQPDEREVSLARRRFAAAFHSDRVVTLPSWVGEVFDQLLAIVNEACDRAKR